LIIGVLLFYVSVTSSKSTVLVIKRNHHLVIVNVNAIHETSNEITEDLKLKKLKTLNFIQNMTKFSNEL